MSLGERARDFVRSGSYEMELSLLAECIEAGTTEGLIAVQLMFEDMYGGMTFNYEFEAPPAFCLVRWGETGLDALIESARRTPTTKNRSLAVEILATLASGSRLPQLGQWVREKAVCARIVDAIESWDDLFAAARRRLSAYILSFEDEEEIAVTIGSEFQKVGFGAISLARGLFAAMATRWMSVSLPTLAEFERLIVESRGDEAAFQSFLELHPQLVDPMVSEVWPRPRIHGAREPDFIVKRTDDTYLIVEIETPAKTLVTGSNRLSAEATHAVAQVADYVSFLSERFMSVRQSIPSFRQPEGLVLVGIEGKLNPEQARALRLENESRHRIHVAGFDWLAKRARSIVDNVVAQDVRVVRGLRIS